MIRQERLWRFEVQPEDFHALGIGHLIDPVLAVLWRERGHRSSGSVESSAARGMAQYGIGGHNSMREVRNCGPEQSDTGG